MIRLVDMRLRVPLTEEQEKAAITPNQYRQAWMAQPALRPGKQLPLAVSVWPKTPHFIVEGILRAGEAWNNAMRKHAGINTAFLVRDVESPLKKDVMVGTKTFPFSFVAEREFGKMPVGALLPDRGASLKRFGTSMNELGDCELFWNDRYEVYAGHLAARVFVADDLDKKIDMPTIQSVVAHELGHALLLGHEPVHPWRLMYKRHGAVLGPKPKECEWVAEIWKGV